ncbi:hypothetical protein OS493_008457 [Desmophyllum pertusum]|uniref:Uncharacterized protein n=1 Tax=Desmophyllum pertusum TaxID=174260 RepID=A0A9X0D5E2_9CNID|nr:hypothetical protein OS493_008457 [Desmophyllum pertusum]
MKNLCEKGTYVAVSCDVGTLTVESIEYMCNRGNEKSEGECQEPTTNRQPTKLKVVAGEGKNRQQTKMRGVRAGAGKKSPTHQDGTSRGWSRKE